MKFLDANGLALFTKKIFNKFISDISGVDNKLTITKGDGTTTNINLNEVIKNDIIAENPPEDDNTLKIASTSWVQSFVAVMVFKLIAKLAETSETGVGSSGNFLGVNWLIAKNGYLYLGKLFKGITFEWGTVVLSKDIQEDIVQKVVTLPIELSSVLNVVSSCNALINNFCYIHPTLPNITIGRGNYSADTTHYYFLVGKK